VLLRVSIVSSSRIHGTGGTGPSVRVARSAWGGNQTCRLGVDHRPVPAIAELGRIAKTILLLAYIDDEAYRRRILVQLNRGEVRHRLGRAVSKSSVRWVWSSTPSSSGISAKLSARWPNSSGRAWRSARKTSSEPGRSDFTTSACRAATTFDLPEQQLTRGELRSLRDPSDAAGDEIPVA
jgi:hypothetical protein